MGPGVDKLRQVIAGRPLLAHSLLAFSRSSIVDEIVLVSREDRREDYRRLADEHGVTKLSRIIAGGVERQDSVWCGLMEVSASSEVVLIHDGARPCVTHDIITRCVEGARSRGAVIPAARVKDTIKKAGADLRIEDTPDRSMLWAAQTPQTFLTPLIKEAYEPLIRRKIVVTDDACAVERLGRPVWIVECPPTNLKVTTQEDFRLAGQILQAAG